MKKFLLISATVLTLSACSETKESWVEGCLNIGMEEQMKGMEESDRFSVKKGVEQGCQMFVQECKKSPDGEMCIAVKKKFGAKD
ncbi:hypothetical protein [Pelagibaculum spongiae]|uniref:Uncharacterized protein n=1 Tax=Pelagibaculum spongiae TaxID=2080658 RepID=A0A2V1H0J1_9GAMM|nr:hypothetical protein [Pelagibaculum spongiae]PVZ69522.1 hypothetical protein DC094_09335 [Pelagibaculum spongiae]